MRKQFCPVRELIRKIQVFLMEAEWNEWNEKFESEIESGAVEVSLRKTRSDAGKKRKVGQQSVESGGSNDQNQQVFS
ncbi:hypothetical protein FRC12_024835 [Ceratobasidium sp. 428]|nr:hypothetical protein FRC12_024835 [Ceratobasidium sp. 428]